MREKFVSLTLFAAAFLVCAVSLNAITFGKPDGNGHPYVGSMVVELEGGSLVQGCSGTLISSTVFITASHCVAWMQPAGVTKDDVFVTFDPEFTEDSEFHAIASYHVNPNYGYDQSDPYDVAVLVLKEPIENITPASLPPAGLLDDLKASKLFKHQQFVTVGYGMVREDKTHGWQTLYRDGVRRYVEQEPLALEPSWLQLSMNPSTGNGGTCFGDSGGPHFLGDSNIVAAITVTGDRFCRATDKTYRMDTSSARDFLAQFVALP